MIATLMYHIVDRRIWSEIAVTEEAFEEQLAHVRREGYEVLTLDEVVRVAGGAAPMPERGLHFTFDDGYADNLHAALPRLCEHGIEPTVFVPTAAVGTRDAWNARAEAGLRYMDWPELEAWLDGGGRIGGHTHGHETAGDVPHEVMAASIARGRRLLEERLGVEPVAFAYPNGAVTREARDEVARAYEIAWTVTRGTWHPREDRYRLNRFGVGRHAGIDEFARELDELFESFTSRRVRLARRLRGRRAASLARGDATSGAPTALVAGDVPDDPAYPAAARFAALLAEGRDAHLLHRGTPLDHPAVGALPADLLRERLHPPPEDLRRALPRGRLVTGLARTLASRPGASLDALRRPAPPGVRYLRAVLLGLRPELLRVHDPADSGWRAVGRAVGARVERDDTRRGIDPALLDCPPVPPEGPVHVLALSPLTWRSGLEHLLAAIRELRDRDVACLCRIVGDGEHEGAVWFARRQLGLEEAVEILAPGGASLVDHLRWAHVLVDASLEPATAPWHDAARAAGREVVATGGGDALAVADALGEVVERRGAGVAAGPSVEL